MKDFTLEQLQILRVLTSDSLDEFYSPRFENLYIKINNLIRQEEEYIRNSQVIFKWASPEEYTIKNLQTAPDGTYITYYHQACSNVKIQSNIQPLEHLKLYSRLFYTHCSVANRPSAIAIKCSPETWTMLHNGIIESDLFPKTMNLPVNQYNTLTNIGILDFGFITPV